MDAEFINTVKAVKAAELVEKVIDSGYNQSRLARGEGLSGVSGVFNSPTVKAVRNWIAENPEVEKRLIEMAMEGLRAEKAIVVDGKVEYVEDWYARHKFWADICKMKKWLEKGDVNIDMRQQSIAFHEANQEELYKMVRKAREEMAGKKDVSV